MELVSPDSAGVDLSPAFRAVRESVIYGLLAGLLGAIVFIAVLGGQEPLYRTNTTVMVSSPARNEATVEQLAVQARAFGEIVNDDAIRDSIQGVTGIEVNPVGASPNVKVTAPEDKPGVLNISTEADSPDASKQLSDAVIAEVRTRAQTVRDQALGDFEQAYQGLIQELEQKRNLAADDPTRVIGVSSYDTAINELRAAQQQPRLNHLTVSLLSQETESEEEIATRPKMMGIVLGIVLGLFVFAVVAALKLFFPRRVNEVWLRRIAARDGVDVEFSGGGLAPRTSALSAALRREGEQVLQLSSGHGGAGGEDEPSETLLVRRLDDQWWEDTDTNAVAFAVVDIDRGAKINKLVEQNLDVLASLGIPARVSVGPKRGR